jgi:outer membrane protein assembly factor BamA
MRQSPNLAREGSRMNLDYSNDFATGEEDNNLEYQSYFQGYVNDLTFAGNDDVSAQTLARQLALKAMKGQSFNEAENNALLGVIPASQVDFDV